MISKMIRNRSYANTNSSLPVPSSSASGSAVLDCSDDNPNSKEISSSLNSNNPVNKHCRFQFGWQRTLIMIATCFVIYLFLLIISPKPLAEHSNRESRTEQITIVMNTFKRHDMMLDALQYYTSCKLVKYVYVIWSEDTPPPADIVNKFANSEHPKVIFNEQAVDSLNNRFKPLPGPHNDAIFSVDDDMRVPCEDLQLAYEVWRSSPRSLVGFMPRIHLRSSTHPYRLEYRCWWRVWWHGVYSIILTKAAILHHDFFDVYTNKMDPAVHTLINRRRNCEDIAMQFLIANETSLPPIYVKGHVWDEGVLGGISTSQNIAQAAHMHERDDCLNDLEKIFRGVPLISSHMVVDAANNGWTNVPSSWFEYISSDLWKW